MWRPDDSIYVHCPSQPMRARGTSRRRHGAVWELLIDCLGEVIYCGTVLLVMFICGWNTTRCASLDRLINMALKRVNLSNKAKAFSIASLVDQGENFQDIKPAHWLESLSSTISSFFSQKKVLYYDRLMTKSLVHPQKYMVSRRLKGAREAHKVRFHKRNPRWKERTCGAAFIAWERKWLLQKREG